MGAVIGMRGDTWDRKALFDIGITGPLAGLVPTLIFCVLGLQQSQIVMGRDNMGDPLLMQLMVRWIFGPLGPGEVVAIHPVAYAGWVGVFITALNLLPIGQLDGGHILYALLRRKAHLVASAILMLAIAAMIFNSMYQWLPMVFLLLLIGPYHPPTANDKVPLGTTRVILGWATLAFVIIGFTPTPFL
jgi:membrane-associated protease RseP (regulator of RpoE activity)